MNMEQVRAISDALAKEAADRGKLIEAGWHAARVVMIPPDTSPEQLRLLKAIFMGGAQHLYASIMTILDPGEEPTENDLRKMDLIDKELQDWATIMMALMTDPAKGSA